MSLHPIFLRLEGRTVLVVGAGSVALEKADRLREAGAVVRLVAPDARGEGGEIRAREFQDGDLDGVWLAVAAATPEVNRQVREAADRRHVFTIAVDDVERCSAFGAARIDRGGLTVAISSSGSAPALVALLREALEAVLPDDVGAWHGVAARARHAWRSNGTPMRQRRPLLLRALVALYSEGRPS